MHVYRLTRVVDAEETINLCGHFTVCFPALPNATHPSHSTLHLHCDNTKILLSAPLHNTEPRKLPHLSSTGWSIHCISHRADSSTSSFCRGLTKLFNSDPHRLSHCKTHLLVRVQRGPAVKRLQIGYHAQNKAHCWVCLAENAPENIP